MILIVTLILITFISYFLKWPAINKGMNTETRIFNKLKKQGDIAISKETHQKLKEENDFLKDELTKVSNIINPPTQIIPEDIIDTSIFFRQSLYATQKRLKAEATQKNIFLVESLGFGQELPQAEMVEVYVRRLNLTEELVSSLLKNGVFSINLISLSDLKPITEEEKDILKLGVQINFDTSEEALMSFLKEIAKQEPIIVIEEIQVEKLEERKRLNVSILASSFIFK